VEVGVVLAIVIEVHGPDILMTSERRERSRKCDWNRSKENWGSERKKGKEQKRSAGRDNINLNHYGGG
jgi:hypothetical protein